MRTAIFAAAAMVVSTWVNAQEIDWKKVDDALGRSAAVTGTFIATGSREAI